MTNEITVNDVDSDEVAGAGSKPKEFRSKRGRRIMVATLIFLIFLLLIATLFLLNLIMPKGEVATSKDAGGVTWVRSIYGYGPSEAQQLVNPAAVAFQRNGDVIIPNVGTTQVRGLRFAPSGVYKTMFAGSPLNAEGVGFLAYPGAVSIAPDGRMYFVQGPRDEVMRTDPTGQKTEGILKVQGPSAVDVNAERIAVGSQNGWVVTDLEGNPLVGPVGRKGKGPNDYDVVGGIVLDDQNNVYVVDSFNNRISKFNAAGKRLWQVATGLPGNTKALTGGEEMKSQAEKGDKSQSKLQAPSGACLDGAGRLLVVDPLDFSITAFKTEDGSFVAKFGEFGQDEGKFLYPSGIAYDPARDWVAVADTMNNRVQIIRLPGTGGSALTGFRRSLAGPLRACLFPLIVLLIAVISWFVWRRRQKRTALKASRQVANAEASDAASESASDASKTDSITS